MSTKYKGPGIVLVIDTSDAATPAIVEHEKSGATATFDCAVGTGELCGRDYYHLSPAQLAWLDTKADIAENAYDVARAGHPEYS